MKAAFVVDFRPCTRVVVDVEKLGPGKLSDADEQKIIDAAIEKMLKDPAGYICWDNLLDISDDDDVPYDPEKDI